MWNQNTVMYRQERAAVRSIARKEQPFYNLSDQLDIMSLSRNGIARKPTNRLKVFKSKSNYFSMEIAANLRGAIKEKT
jgi:hypothetical protein